MFLRKELDLGLEGGGLYESLKAGRYKKDWTDASLGHQEDLGRVGL